MIRFLGIRPVSNRLSHLPPQWKNSSYLLPHRIAFASELTSGF
jgi:hypothetical protein